MGLARSMTGFGRASLAVDGRELTIELKSVNNRYLDIAFRLPRTLTYLEDVIRTVIGSALSRGHIEVYAAYTNTRSDSKSVRFNIPLLTAYLEQARSAAAAFGLAFEPSMTELLQIPDAVTVEDNDDDRDAVSELARRAAADACAELIEMRSREGARLAADIDSRLDVLAELRGRIAERAPYITADYRNKLNERISAAVAEVDVDRARLATEIALFADKVNIDEELVRLVSHISAARELLSDERPTGRRLDFVVQEMNREFNTIGSKANDLTIAQLVIDAKAELEKIREQIQNFE